MKLIVQIVRLIVGGLFIFSGFIKANDPLGFAYKMEEYFTVFGTERLIPTALFLSIFVCVFEMLLGFMLLLGSRIRLVLWLSLAMIVFFTFLTFYSAYYDKVTDCGCFGDFLHLTPWTSFTKDVVLLALILVLFAGRRYITPLLAPRPERISLIAFAAFSLFFPLYTYNFLPVFDFRPYKIGTNLVDAMKVPPGGEGRFETNVYYKNLKTGERKAFPPNNLPWRDSLTWKFDTTVTVTLVEPVMPPVHDFTISTPEGSEYTEDFLTHVGPQFFLVCYDLSLTNKKVFGKINDFAQLCKKDNIPFICLTSSAAMIQDFKRETAADFDFYVTDRTQLKTMIRSNPGLILLNGPVVTAMWHYRSFPSYTEVKQRYFNDKKG
ncbi:MAG: BT_3928 family protein [Bacteroidota bacterium]